MKVGLAKVLRYVISGGTGALVNIGTLFVMVHYLSVWYLTSSICAFLASFLVSFSLQRMWTFRQSLPRTVGRQIGLYLVAALCNLVLNTAIVYVCVEYLRIWYILSQIIAGSTIAVESFFVYKHMIFTESDPQI
ncbi:MAG TPA: GtrA family protein [Candidatus Paceibacterota bacterium]|nr:GtrA family protein [Candidatus Paceibacterota bacterium]